MAIVPKGVIVHSMSEYLKLDDGPMYARDFLESIGLSVHGFVKPNGTYEKMVSSPGKAFHAGHSEWNGLSGLNSHYLGFELLVPGTHDYGSFSKAIETEGTYSEEQMKTSIDICRYWMEKYNIPAENIVRHSDCSGDHVRGKGKGKTDPGSAFDWDKFQKALVA
jgi:N-acetyl-anhydromuramyl-L-alanine amidase AmpD|tara:strand:+ start:3128 stop:3619 length:492 start_codon:yes stop_codon:yes gene_type:complete